MKKHHFLFKLWRISYPMVIHLGALVALTFIGSIVISLAIGYQADVQDAQLSDNLIRYILSNKLVRYAVLLTGFGNLAAIPLLSLFMRLDKRKYPEGKLLEKAHPATYIFAVFAGILFCIGLNQLITLIQLFYRFDNFNESMSMIYLGNIWEEIICVAILAPIGEELCFRGLVFKRLRGYTRFVPAMLISSLFFGVYHGNLIQGCYAFFLGCVLAYAHEKYQNVLAPIIIHMVANAISVISTETDWLNFLFKNWSTVITSMIVCLICGILMLVAMKLSVITKRDIYVPPYIPPMAPPNAAMFALPVTGGNVNLQAIPVYTTLPDGISQNGISCPVGMMTPQGFVPLYYLMPGAPVPMMQPQPMELSPMEMSPMETDTMKPQPLAEENTGTVATETVPQDIPTDTTEEIVEETLMEDITTQDSPKALSEVDKAVQDEALLDDFFVQEFELDD
ncbi:MAG: CPBP family intramembrane metalloprotease [Lachnospiraceae bacterium]|nr:CPBP family intramembrane metalloprotease [Lachnospiraceae bacterium]